MGELELELMVAVQSQRVRQYIPEPELIIDRVATAAVDGEHFARIA